MATSARTGRRGRTDVWRSAVLPLVGTVGLLAAVGSALADPTVVEDGVPHVANPAVLPGGTQTVNLVALWRAGGADDDEVLFGAIGDAIGDEDHNTYVLDSQLCQVSVFAPDGGLVGTLSREGDGPGETRRPAGLTFMPDGNLGIYQRFPGKVVLIDLHDTPAGSYTPGGDRTEGGFSGIQSLRCRNGRIVCSGNRMTRNDETMTRTGYLALLDGAGGEQVRYLEHVREIDFARHEFIERDNYFVDADRWALGPEGRVYAAPERDAYRIEVFAPDGTSQLVIERDYTPHRRTQEEKDDVAAGVVAVVNGRRVQLDTQIEDCAPVIESLRVDDAGLLWVEHDRSGRDQPDGVMQTYDVYDPQGRLVRQVAFRCEGDGREDRLFFTGTDRVLLVKGYRQARRSMFGGGGNEDDAEPAADLEVVCYRVQP